MDVAGAIRSRRLRLVPFDEALAAAWRAGRLEEVLQARRPAEWDGRRDLIGAWSEAPAGHAIWRGWGAWLVLHQGTWVAYANFYGPPNERGEVEIGFEVAPSYRRRGLATELVSALCAWAFDSGARVVRAEVEPANLGSSFVLQGCGFLRCDANCLEERTKLEYRLEVAQCT